MPICQQIATKQPNAVTLPGLPESHRNALAELGFVGSEVGSRISMTGLREIVLPGLAQQLGPHEIIVIPNA